MMPLLSIVIQAGKLIPYAPRRDDAVSVVLLVCFFVIFYVLAADGRFLFQMLQNFMLNRKRFSIFDTSTTSEVNRLFLLILMGCVLSGVSLFTICVTYQPALTDHLAPIALLGIYVAVVILYLLQKWGFYKLLGWMFLDSDTAKLSMESYYTLIYFATFFFLISTLVIVFMRLPLWGSLTLYLSVFLILRIFIFFKWIKLFSVKKYGLLRFFLYFCALEIVPIILAGAIVLIINELLILNL